MCDVCVLALNLFFRKAPFVVSVVRLSKQSRRTHGPVSEGEGGVGGEMNVSF